MADNVNYRSMLPPGSFLKGGMYRVDRYLGSGNFGNTYMVSTPRLNRPLAMKEFFLSGFCFRGRDSRTLTLSPTANPQTFAIQREKFKKEALRLHGLQSQHVVHVHDMFEENATVYYIMDFVWGESLADMLERTKTPLPEDRALSIMMQILDALEDIHNKQIWHLDLKPDNVMLEHETGRAVVIDFGASKQLGQQGRYTGTTGVLCYTPGFAPMEQVSQDLNSVGPWTDIYALGATIYNILTNEAPPSFTLLQEKAAVKFPSSVSKATRNLILWMMRPNRSERPQSVAAVRGYIAQNGLIKGWGQQGSQPNGYISGRHTNANGNNNMAGYISGRPCQESGQNMAGNISGRKQQQNSPHRNSPVKKPWSNKTALIVISIIVFTLFIITLILSSAT